MLLDTDERAGERWRMELLTAAALAGLIATPHCAAMCGGFATACGAHTRGLVAWHAGRLTTYALLGAGAGGFGAIVPGPVWLPAVLSTMLLVWFAASMAGLVAQPAARLPGLARAGAFLIRRNDTPARLAFGALNGLLPCGMVYAALALAIASASPLSGAAAMLAFGAATVPGLSMLSAGIRRFAARGVAQRRALAALMLVAGFWSIAGRAVHAQHVDRQHQHGAAAQR